MAILANELRIGNLFYQIDRSNTVNLPITIPIKVLEINMFNVSACLADENPAMMKTIPVISMSDLSPIPLTPEILEKCNIERTGNLAKSAIRKFYKIGKIIIESIAENRIAVYIDSPTELVLISFQNYLHQLQNLYFALTGEELTFKP